MKIDCLRKGLGTSLFAVNIVFRETVKSTNSLCKDLGAKGAPEGTLVLAEMQTAGRGRMGRMWLSPGHVNLLFSLLLRPPIQAERVFFLNMVLALACIEAVEAVSGISPGIKWPNDLYVGHKKLGGILTEFEVLGRDVAYVVQGLGLNVNWNPEKEAAVRYPATSVRAEAGAPVSRVDVLVRLLKRFEDYYGQVLHGTYTHIQEKWNQRALFLGKRVEIETREGRLTGTATRIDASGALIICEKNGREQRIMCGDVTVKRDSLWPSNEW